MKYMSNGFFWTCCCAWTSENGISNAVATKSGSFTLIKPPSDHQVVDMEDDLPEIVQRICQPVEKFESL